MGRTLGKLAVIFGMMLLVHTGYSVSQLRSFLRFTEDEFSSLPLDMMLEGLIGVAIAVWGAAAMQNFKEIRAIEDMASKSYESFLHRPSFITFNHRGKRLFGES